MFWLFSFFLLPSSLRFGCWLAIGQEYPFFSWLARGGDIFEAEFRYFRVRNYERGGSWDIADELHRILFVKRS